MARKQATDKKVAKKTKEKTERNAEIQRRFLAGEILSHLAQEYGISVQRASQIVYMFQE